MGRDDACLVILEVAKKELGVHETPGPEATTRIMEYETYTNRGHTGNDEEAWCSKFANFVTYLAGYPGTKSAAARSWLKWGVPLIEPIPGCIVIIDRHDDNNPNAAHVTFFDQWHTSDVLSCLGGNQGDMVKYSQFQKSKVLGYRSPF